MSRQRGSAAVELPLVLGLLLLPFGLLVLQFPRWVERQTAARDVAGEVARFVVTGGDPSEVGALVARMEAGHGLEPGSIVVESVPVLRPGETVAVAVRVSIPAVTLPLFGSLGPNTLRVEHAERVPDFAAVLGPESGSVPE